MNTAQVIPFKKSPQPKQEADMSTKPEGSGYTPLPNYLVDDDYIAKMTGNSLKCYVVINRFTKGFSRKDWAIESKFLLKKTAIKKPHTLFEAVKQLESLGLLSVHREDGKTNKFTVTDPCLKTALPINETTAENGLKGSAENGNSTTAENGHTKKDNIKYKFKNIKKDDLPVDNSENEMFGSSVKYHEDDKKQYSLRELANVYTVQTDLAEQAKRIDPKLDDAKILSELKNFAQWSTSREKTTAQGWMNYWIYRIQKLVAPKAKSQKTTKAKSKSLSDAQVNYFVSELCNYSTFASLYSNVGETQKSFEARISANLRKPEYAKTYGPYLAELGFVVDLGPEL